MTTITNQLQTKGDLPFVDYMQLALYHPTLGYYSGGLQKFGSGGDFVTAPELTPLFGFALANQCQQVLLALDKPLVFEFGAGSGRLCIDVLTRLEQLGCLPFAYHILEISPDLCARQKEAIQAAIPHLADRVKWVSNWPEKPFNGVVLANEVLDAMPVHRFTQTDNGLLESFVTLNQGGLVEQFKPCRNERLKAYVQSVLSPDLYPYQSEANLYIDGWLEQCYHMLEKGALFIIDYGFPRHEYYHPDRYAGTLMCHYRHQSHTNPLAHPGEEDMTAHVDFTHVAEAAVNAGFDVSGYTNQGAFLMANGLLDTLAVMTDEKERLKNNQAVKTLLQENEMGELFKVMALTKAISLPLTGFQLTDKRMSL